MSNIPFKQKMSDKLHEMNAFGQAYQFKLPGNKRKFNTTLGVVLTTIIAIILLYYGAVRMLKLVFRKDSDVKEILQDSYFSADDIFSTDNDGLQFAFGITSFDSNTESIEDPDYGHLSASYLTWGLSEEFGIQHEEIPIRNCTPGELGLGAKEESNFFPIKEKQKHDLVR